MAYGEKPRSGLRSTFLACLALISMCCFVAIPLYTAARRGIEQERVERTSRLQVIEPMHWDDRLKARVAIILDTQTGWVYMVVGDGPGRCVQRLEPTAETKQ